MRARADRPRHAPDRVLVLFFGASSPSAARTTGRPRRRRASDERSLSLDQVPPRAVCARRFEPPKRICAVILSAEVTSTCARKPRCPACEGRTHRRTLVSWRRAWRSHRPAYRNSLRRHGPRALRHRPILRRSPPNLATRPATGRLRNSDPLRYSVNTAGPAAERQRSAKEGDAMTAVQRVVADLKVLCGAWGDNP